MNKLFIIIVSLLMVCSIASAELITDKGAKPQDSYQLMKELIYNSNHKLMGSAGLGSATTYITVTGTPVAIVEGEFVTLTATSTVSFSTPYSTVAAGKVCAFSVGVTSAGDYVTKQSKIVDATGSVVLPLFDTGTTLIGAVTVSPDSDGEFIPNTTVVTAAWASGTATIENLSNYPLSFDINLR